MTGIRLKYRLMRFKSIMVTANLAAISGLAAGIGLIITFSVLFSPSHIPASKISKEQAVEIAVRDLTMNYIKNPPLIKIYAIGNEQAQGAVYLPVETFLVGNYTLVMAHTTASGVFYFVDANTGTLEKCNTLYCPLPEQGMEAIKDRLAWIVDLATRCDNYPNNGADVIYAIDSTAGRIIWHHNSSPYEPGQPFICS